MFVSTKVPSSTYGSYYYNHDIYIYNNRNKALIRDEAVSIIMYKWPKVCNAWSY